MCHRKRLKSQLKLPAVDSDFLPSCCQVIIIFNHSNLDWGLKLNHIITA